MVEFLEICFFFLSIVLMLLLSAFLISGLIGFYFSVDDFDNDDRFC